MWAAKSRRGETCGIFGCDKLPYTKCEHCGNHYCEEHKWVIGLLVHPRRKATEDEKT